MDLSLLKLLRCPFCGGRLELGRSALLKAQSGEVLHGTLSCHCCAYPIVSGIPYLCDDDTAPAALDLLLKGHSEEALLTLLGLRGTARKQFRRLLSGERALTFRSALSILCRQGGRTYFLYRFSDPTFLCSLAVLRALGQDRRCFTKPVLDLGGGPGHLTRFLPGGCPLIQANLSFWELWLAKRFLAPSCQPVCCDANKPLPFSRGTFSFVLCSDAFHYIWSKRLLACELVRLIDQDGAILLTHVHNALCDNEAAGLPLAPASYRDLFEGLEARLFKETDVMNGILNRAPVDLSVRYTEEELAGERALILLASRRTELFRVYKRPKVRDKAHTLAVNPLYRLKHRGSAAWLQLQFPYPEFAADYANYNLFLPKRIDWTRSMQEGLRTGRLDRPPRELAERYVLLDLPEDYL
jgi:uncharacterized protein YbaR (Trm112 family)